MNYLAHLAVAAASSASPRYALGAVLSDLCALSGLRCAYPRLTGELAAGLRCHRAADRAFHADPAFLAGAGSLRAAALAAGLPPGASRAIGHAGWELLLDGSPALAWAGSGLVAALGEWPAASPAFDAAGRRAPLDRLPRPRGGGRAAVARPRSSAAARLRPPPPAGGGGSVGGGPSAGLGGGDRALGAGHRPAGRRAGGLTAGAGGSAPAPDRGASVSGVSWRGLLTRSDTSTRASWPGGGGRRSRPATSGSRAWGASHPAQSSGRTTTGMRSWTAERSGLAMVVTIATVRSTWPSGPCQISQIPARAMSDPSTGRTKNGRPRRPVAVGSRRHSKNPLAGTRHRRRWKAARNEGALATVSARALISRWPVLGFVAQLGTRPQRRVPSLRRSPSRTATTESTCWDGATL